MAKPAHIVIAQRIPWIHPFVPQVLRRFVTFSFRHLLRSLWMADGYTCI